MGKAIETMPDKVLKTHYPLIERYIKHKEQMER
jgi:hypothetical protein